MSPKGVYERTPENTPRPRRYPAEIVEVICGFYESGMTVREVIEVAPPGYKVQNILERHLAERRRAIKRDQRGELNASWKGDAVSYDGVHERMKSLRGKASEHACHDCGRSAKEWSYVGGCPRERRDPSNGCAYSPDLARYEPRCRSCHRSYDLARRNAS